MNLKQYLALQDFLEEWEDARDWRVACDPDVTGRINATHVYTARALNARNAALHAFPEGSLGYVALREARTADAARAVAVAILRHGTEHTEAGLASIHARVLWCTVYDDIVASMKKNGAW